MPKKFNCKNSLAFDDGTVKKDNFIKHYQKSKLNKLIFTLLEMQQHKPKQHPSARNIFSFSQQEYS